MLHPLPHSMFYLSILSLLALILAFRVVKVRMSSNIGLGTGDDENLMRQIRVQANLLENLLPFSILFILAELSGFSVLFLHLAGGLFLLARLFHAYGFSQNSGKSRGRYYGTLVSWISLLMLIVMNLYQVIYLTMA